MIISYKDLIVWQKSIELVKEVYLLTKSFPREELYGLVSQMRRAAVAIPSNIAEGYGRKTKKDRCQFYLISFSSALELETQITISKELSYIEEKETTSVISVLQEILKMLNSMTKDVRSS